MIVLHQRIDLQSNHVVGNKRPNVSFQAANVKIHRAICKQSPLLLDCKMEQKNDINVLIPHRHMDTQSFQSGTSANRFHIIQLMHSFEVNIRICQPEKVMSTETKQSREAGFVSSRKWCSPR